VIEFKNAGWKPEISLTFSLYIKVYNHKLCLHGNQLNRILFYICTLSNPYCHSSSFHQAWNSGYVIIFLKFTCVKFDRKMRNTNKSSIGTQPKFLLFPKKTYVFPVSYISVVSFQNVGTYNCFLSLFDFIRCDVNYKFSNNNIRFFGKEICNWHLICACHVYCCHKLIP